MIAIKDFERSDIEYILDEASKLENITELLFFFKQKTAYEISW